MLPKPKLEASNLAECAASLLFFFAGRAILAFLAGCVAAALAREGAAEGAFHAAFALAYLLPPLPCGGEDAPPWRDLLVVLVAALVLLNVLWLPAAARWLGVLA